MSALPDWVKLEAIAHHKPSLTCFLIQHCQRDRRTNKYFLLDAPKGVKGAEYPLDECEPATRQHFKSVALLTVGGKAFSVIRQDDLLIVVGEGYRHHVRIDPTPDAMSAAQSLALAFDGAIYTEEMRVNADGS